MHCCEVLELAVAPLIALAGWALVLLVALFGACPYREDPLLRKLQALPQALPPLTPQRQEGSLHRPDVVKCSSLLPSQGFQRVRF